MQNDSAGMSNLVFLTSNKKTQKTQKRPVHNELSSMAFLNKMKGKNKTEQAQLVGEAVADRAKGKGLTKVVFDRGGYKYIGRVKALADGARKSGLDF